jgi:hypothetical protein
VGTNLIDSEEDLKSPRVLSKIRDSEPNITVLARASSNLAVRQLWNKKDGLIYAN